MSMDDKDFSTTVNMAVAMLLAPDKKEKKNLWLEQFEAADEEEKLRIIWKVVHLETMNSVSKDALRTMFRWLVEYALEPDV